MIAATNEPVASRSQTETNGHSTAPTRNANAQEKPLPTPGIRVALDLERTFDLIGGDIFHGSLDLRQLFSARPMVGHADYLA
jgi:phytoene dehydrogenase-like protein